MSMIKGRALVAHAVNEPFKLEDIEIDSSQLLDDEAVVKYKCSGICHTDTSVWQGVLPFAFPNILGHEGGGKIEVLPKNYSGPLKVGDTVVLSFNMCKNCAHCRDGYPAGCDMFLPINFGGLRSNQTAFKTKTASGTEVFTGFFGQSSFASHGIVAMNSILKVDPSTPLEQVCAFGCGIQTGFGTVLNTLLPNIQPRNFSHLPSINDLGLPVSSSLLNGTSKPHQPQTLAIFGLGAVGMGAVVAGHLAKDIIERVVVIDLVDTRLKMAQQAGATHLINASGKSPEQIVEEIKQASVDGRGATISFEATGVPAVLTNAINCLAPRGRCAMAGAAPAGHKIDCDVSTLLLQQWSIAGMIEGDSDPEILIPYMLAQTKRGAFDIMKQLVKTYKPEEIDQAMKDAKSGQVVKPVIVWD